MAIERKVAYLPFLFADPQLVERPKAGKDATTEPCAVPTLRGVTRRVDLNLHCNDDISTRHTGERVRQREKRERTCGRWRVSSVLRRSAKPASMLPPPVRTMLPKSTWRRSWSHAPEPAEMSAGIVFGRFEFEACGTN